MKKYTKPLAAVGAALLIAFPLAGCSAIETLKKSAADAWSVTYELSADADTTLTDVAYLTQASRTEDRATSKASELAVEAGEPWTRDSIVLVKDTVSISAKPGAGVRATCRILLDGVREIAAETGEPGAAVNCKTVTPEFDKD